MAPKASRKGGDSKQGLVIALVIFVLLTIVLGITAYTGYTADDGKDKKITEEKNAKENKQKDLEFYKFQSLKLLSYMGQLKNEDQPELDSLGVKYKQPNAMGGDPKERAALEVVITNVEKKQAMPWDAGKNPPELKAKHPYEKVLVDAQTEYEKLRSTIDGLRNEKDTALAAAKKAVDDFNTFRVENEAKYNQVKADTVREKQVEVKRADDQQGEKERLSVEKNQALQDAAAEKAKLEAEVKAKNIEIYKLKAELKIKIDDLAQIKNRGIEAPADWRTDWKILRIEPLGTTAYINLGSADLVKEQLTFSIHGLDQGGKPVSTPKGTLEVMNVLDSHLSQVRITSVKDRDREPVLKGDVLFNPGWNPTQKKHVAITGLIDLTGEGQDQMAVFKRYLDRHNVIVDAWVEKRGDKAVIMGPGISVQTDWLVEGDGPEYLNDAGKSGYRDTLGAVMQKMRDTAKDKGVSVVGYRKYMESVGFRMPRMVGDRPSYRPSNADDTVKEKDDKPPMEDKKEDKKDDKKDDKKVDKKEDKKDDKNQ